MAFILMLAGGSGEGVRFSVNYRVNVMEPQQELPGMRQGTLVNPGRFDNLIAGMIVLAVILFILSIFLFAPLHIGAKRFFVVSHYQKAMLSELGYAFSPHYWNVVKTMFLKGLYISLWSLLLVIPGIIKMYEYRMIPYILAENPGIGTKEAFALSKQMMDGNKGEALILDLSFFGWYILGALTFNILTIFYVNPYVFMTSAELYVAIKETYFGIPGIYYQNAGPFAGDGRMPQ